MSCAPPPSRLSRRAWTAPGAERGVGRGPRGLDSVIHPKHPLGLGTAPWHTPRPWLTPALPPVAHAQLLSGTRAFKAVSVERVGSRARPGPGTMASAGRAPRGCSRGGRGRLTRARVFQDPQQCQPGSPEAQGRKPGSSPSDFSDPVYKEIAVTNGYINRMSKEELRAKLSEFKLETRGVKDVLKKRLKNYYKKEKLTQHREDGDTNSYYDYICVIDFEATCEEGNPPEFTHEIIEFPIVLLNMHTLEIEDTFQQYVRPEINTQLSDFCINLTGITQDMVDHAETFPQVLQNVVDWMRLKELGTKYKYSILTDGSWDMSKFLNIQCQISRLRYPSFAKKWINIRKSYGNFYKVPRNQTKLSIMLEKLGMSYDGRPHSGLDDSKNIARIAVRMLRDGCELRVNEKMHGEQLTSVASSSPVEGAPAPQMPHFRN